MSLRSTWSASKRSILNNLYTSWLVFFSSEITSHCFECFIIHATSSNISNSECFSSSVPHRAVPAKSDKEHFLPSVHLSHSDLSVLLIELMQKKFAFCRVLSCGIARLPTFTLNLLSWAFSWCKEAGTDWHNTSGLKRSASNYKTEKLPSEIPKLVITSSRLSYFIKDMFSSGFFGLLQ